MSRQQWTNGWFAGVLWMGLTATSCVEKPSPELLETVVQLDRQLRDIQAAEFARTEYLQFVQHWVALNGRLSLDDQEIRWPWEPDTLLAELQQVRDEGQQAIDVAVHKRESERLDAHIRLKSVERRLRHFARRVDEMDSRILLGKQAVEAELLVKQARSFYNDGLYTRSVSTTHQVVRILDRETQVLTNRLGRYADERNIQQWQRLAKHTIDWSKSHHSSAIVVDKAERKLILYRNGHPILSFPVRLGYSGVIEKRYQGDGATPEGRYRVIKKRDRGHTRFYRAFLLDYPNEDDRKRFKTARASGVIPVSSKIGGEIEIHGENDVPLSLTLGCVMLENAQIDALFPYIEVGTPVSIVGALGMNNTVAQTLSGIERMANASGNQSAEALELEEQADELDSEHS